VRLTDQAYEFHTLLYRASHNEILARFLDHLHALSFRICYLVKVNSGRKNPLFIAAQKWAAFSLPGLSPGDAVNKR